MKTPAGIIFALPIHPDSPTENRKRPFLTGKVTRGKRLRRLTLFAVFTGVTALQIACATDKELKAAQYELNQREEHLIELENLSERTPDVQRAILNEEERIITLKSKVYAQTGDDRSDKIYGSGPYNAYLVIAQRPPIEAFNVPKEQRPPFIDDHIRALPGVISVKLLRRASQVSDSTTPKKDPLGLLSDNPALQDCLRAANPNDPLGVRNEDERNAKQRRTCIETFAK